ncbi:MAG: Rpn family recombination-promoting nuclease/putative transposase [Lachnospiraceae bacterium]|nr:Rpn family recombination-promoting nuclease/putative transposase [Lachnospiraceae bacterium]
MSVGDSFFRSREERLAAAKEMNLFSIVFMSVALTDLPSCEYVLRVITGIADLKVIEVRRQYEVAKLVSRDGVLDILAEDGKGQKYNLEIQRKDTVDHARRVRLYSSLIDSELLEKGTQFSDLPELYIIYISETDIWKKGRTTYVVEKKIKDTDFNYDDGLHIIYVNAEVNDGSDIAKMMKYFKNADPNDDSQGDLSKRVHFLKCEEEGADIMCAITDSFVKEGERAGILKSILALMQTTDWDADKVMEALQVPSEDRSTYAAFVKANKNFQTV